MQCMPITEIILNAIASGHHTQAQIVKYTCISHSTVHRVLHNLVNDGKIILHHVDLNGRMVLCYTLDTNQRWRLSSFKHIPIVIENRAPYHFNPHIEPNMIISNVPFYRFIIDKHDCLYGRISLPLDSIFRTLDQRYECHNYLPLFFCPIYNITEQHLRDLVWYVTRSLPVIAEFPNNKIDFLFQSPNVKLSMPQFSALTMKILSRLPSKGASLTQLTRLFHLSRETIRRHLALLVDQQKVKKVTSSIFEEAVWQPNVLKKME